MEINEFNNEFEKGSIFTPPVIFVLVMIPVAIGAFFFFGENNVEKPPKSMWGVYKRNQGNENKEEFVSTTKEETKVEVQKINEVKESINFETTTYQVEFDTSLGKIKLDLYPDIAPGHCKNIIALSKTGFYDGIIFHRVIKDFVCQAGCPQGTGTGGPGYTIDAEFNDKDHVAGTLSMARTSDPDSAGSQFFLCLGRVPHLDKKYTVFGQTADKESLANVMKFNAVQTGAGDRPKEEIKIKKATVIETAK